MLHDLPTPNARGLGRRTIEGRRADLERARAHTAALAAERQRRIDAAKASRATAASAALVGSRYQGGYVGTMRSGR